MYNSFYLRQMIHFEGLPNPYTFFRLGCVFLHISESLGRCFLVSLSADFDGDDITCFRLRPMDGFRKLDLGEDNVASSWSL